MASVVADNKDLTFAAVEVNPTLSAYKMQMEGAAHPHNQSPKDDVPPPVPGMGVWWWSLDGRMLWTSLTDPSAEAKKVDSARWIALRSPNTPMLVGRVACSQDVSLFPKLMLEVSPRIRQRKFS